MPKRLLRLVQVVEFQCSYMSSKHGAVMLDAVHFRSRATTLGFVQNDRTFLTLVEDFLQHFYSALGNHIEPHNGNDPQHRCWLLRPH